MTPLQRAYERGPDDAAVEITTSPVLQDAIDATSESLSLRDFEPAEVVRKASFDPSTPEGSRLLWQLLNSKPADLVGRGKFIATITHWICYQKDVVRMDGSVERDAWVCTWMLADGSTLSTASVITCKQWANVVRANKGYDWSRGLTVEFMPNPSKIKGGNPWYSILPPGN